MISKVVNNISEKYGKEVMFENKRYYLFPTPQEMRDCTKEELRNLKTGFRDEYIYEIVNKINNKTFDLQNIDTMNTNDALAYLMNNKGIGEKVKKNCDFLVKIPMKGKVQSLNASVSTGIVVYEAVKQRIRKEN